MSEMPRWVEQKARCDQCGQEITMPNGDNVCKPLPWPWRCISVVGWAAQFVMCGDACEAKFRGRYERPEASPPPTPHAMSVMPTPVPSGEDTNPEIRLPDEAALGALVDEVTRPHEDPYIDVDVAEDDTEDTS